MKFLAVFLILAKRYLVALELDFTMSYCISLSQQCSAKEMATPQNRRITMFICCIVNKISTEIWCLYERSGGGWKYTRKQRIIACMENACLRCITHNFETRSIIHSLVQLLFKRSNSAHTKMNHHYVSSNMDHLYVCQKSY